MRLSQCLERTKRACQALNGGLQSRPQWVSNFLGRRTSRSDICARPLCTLALGWVRTGGFGIGPSDRARRTTDEETGRNHADTRCEAQTRRNDGFLPPARVAV